MTTEVDANDLLRVSSLSIGDLKLQSQLVVTGTTNSASSSPAFNEDYVLTRPETVQSEVEPPRSKRAPASSEKRRSLSRTLGHLAALAGGHARLPEQHALLAPSLRLAFLIPSVLLNVLILPLLVYDSLHSYYFWARSLNESYGKYAHRLLKRRSIAKAPSTDFDRDTFDTARWDPQPWVGHTPLSDFVFVIYTHILCFVHLREVASTKHVYDFRRFLGSHPPHFPISANDDIFRYDEKGSRFQLSMLVVVDQISHAEVREAFRRRWIEWEPKTHAVCARMWNRPCWRVLDDDEFDLDAHIIHKVIDPREKTIAEVVSEMASEEMDPALPQWQVWVVDCQKAADIASEDGTPRVRCDDVARMSYICGKWNHTYSDGVGMMTSIVKRLGDNGVSIDDLPEQYRRRVPWWQVILFYLWHGLRAASQCLEHFCYAAYGIPEYPAMMQPSPGSPLRAPSCQSGRKHYSRAGVFLLRDINVLRDKIRQVNNGPRLTVNDLFLYCLTAAWSRLKNPHELELIIRKCIDLPTEAKSSLRQKEESDEDFQQLQVIVPMMCRTGVPTCMDNFTSLVPAILPLPRSRRLTLSTTEEKRRMVLEDIMRTKNALDAIKRRDQRTTMFLMMCILCKALPGKWTERIYRMMYRKMQFCSTNVAAPPIESQFFGRDVHGLFFWPAVPACCTGGASIVSLGDRFQMLTVIDEAEFTPAVEVAEALLTQNNYEVSAALRTRIITTLADIVPLLVSEEFEALTQLLQ